MPRALRLPKRYADVAGALATRYDDVDGWAFYGPDDWRTHLANRRTLGAPPRRRP